MNLKLNVTFRIPEGHFMSLSYIEDNIEDEIFLLAKKYGLKIVKSHEIEMLTESYEE